MQLQKIATTAFFVHDTELIHLLPSLTFSERHPFNKEGESEEAKLPKEHLNIGVFQKETGH